MGIFNMFLDTPMWGKILRYYQDHQRDSERYPSWRNTWEWSEFMEFIHEAAKGVFGNGGILGQMFTFFLNQPSLDFLLSAACAFGAFSVLRHAFRISHI